MIRPVSFTGKAYFLDGALTHMTGWQKKRIEDYAKKCDDKTSVVVIGNKKETHYEYQGEDYDNRHVTYNTDEGNYRLKTAKGIKYVSKDEIKISDIPVPVFNAYIIYDFNTENIKLPHYTKEFDFRYGNHPSTIFGCNYREYKDIPY